jgi:hypothetical protein
MQHAQRCDAAKPVFNGLGPGDIRLWVDIEPAQDRPVMSRRMTMATTALARAQSFGGRNEARGFFGRLLDRYIEARMARARLHVTAYLQRLDDEALAKLGYRTSEINEIRRRPAHVSLMV